MYFDNANIFNQSIQKCQNVSFYLQQWSFKEKYQVFYQLEGRLTLHIEIGVSLMFKSAPQKVLKMRGRKIRGPKSPAQTNQSCQEASPEPLQIRKSRLQIGDFHLTHNQYLMIMSKLPRRYSLQPLKNENKSRKLLSELNERPNKREMKAKKQEEKFMNDRLRRENSRMTIVSNESADLDDQQSIVTASFFEIRKSQPGQVHEKIVSPSPDKQKQEENPVVPSTFAPVQDLPPQRTQDLKEQQPPCEEARLNPIQQVQQRKPEQPQQREQQHKGAIRRVGLKRGRKSKLKYGNQISKPSSEPSRNHGTEEDSIPKPHQTLEDPYMYEKRFSEQWEILKALQRHSLIGPFLLPVDEERDRAPGYSKVIKHPMDLSTIEGKLKGQAYADAKGFHSDVEQIWKNSIIYNKPGCAMRKVTAELQRFYEGLKNGRSLKDIVPRRGRRI